jgi:hypothetical protein
MKGAKDIRRRRKTATIGQHGRLTLDTTPPWDMMRSLIPRFEAPQKRSSKREGEREMKKFGTLVIAAVFGTALLTGCTKKEETTTTTETSTTEAPAVVEETTTTMTTETTTMATETPAMGTTTETTTTTTTTTVTP